MSQCLRCSKLCEASAVFCDECRSLLRIELQTGTSPHASQQASSSTASTLADSPTLAEHGSVQGDPLERITGPLPGNSADQAPQPLTRTAGADPVEQAVSRLNEAAQRIEQEEEPGKSDRKTRLYSRASRLAPIRDISADIRRESTPLPKISSIQHSETESKNGLEHQLGNGKSPARLGPDSGSGLPDLWPWLDTDTEEKESDIWAGRTDPLISRHFPNSTESASIEEEDIRRAMAEGISTALYSIPRIPRHSFRVRIAFIVIIVFALVAFSVDGFLLLSVTLGHSRHANSTPEGLPTLTLSQNSAHVGDKIQLTMQHFTPSKSVALTHDIQEPIQISGGASSVNNQINTDSTGKAQIPLTIDNTWGPGFHLIVAEDVTTHFTASATLQLIEKVPTPTPPPHLVISNTAPMNFGTEVEGANTIHPLMLENIGGGSITWSASSNKSWLLVSPSQGVFSQSQTIYIAVQRVGLKPGDYKEGYITISSNVSPPEKIEIDMGVRPLPASAGPVIALSPALLSFTASDGQITRGVQSLTISNPGSSYLYWSLTKSDQVTPSTTPSSLSSMPGSASDWLGTDPSSGRVAPGASASIKVQVNSQSLLPGAYIGTLEFSAPGGAYDSPQYVYVSLTVQPRCGIVTSSGAMTFTAVEGQSNPGNQTLSLNATVSCAGAPISWRTTTTASWLTITPASGQLKGTASTVVSISVNASGLAHKNYPYAGDITFSTTYSTQTVTVQLTVQPPPLPAEPIMGASPLSLNFSNTQGQPNPAGQLVTITNNGNSVLKWNSSVNMLSSSWLVATPSGGSIAPGQTGGVTISVITSSNTPPLTPGNYVGQVTLNGKDASGKNAPGAPQTITINLVIQPPCSISPPSSGSVSLSAVQGGVSPTSQTVMFTGTGSCVWPVTWKTTPPASWLTLNNAGKSSTGTIQGTGQSGSIVVAANVGGLTAGTYTTKVTISASDASGGVVQGSPQTLSVTLTILPPCVLSLLPPNLAFSVSQGSPASAHILQNVTLSETGTCAFPVLWKAAGDPGSSAWLVLSSTSGTDSGSGSTLGVNINATTLIPGSYTGQITISATDSAGTVISAQTIAVSVTVTPVYAISGSVVGCPGSTPPSCTPSVPLPGATVTLTTGTITVATAIANASGNYSFTGIAPGTYTVSATGTDTGGVQYVGSYSVVVSSDTTFNINAY